MPATLWEKTKSGSKFGFEKLYAVVDKLGAPVNNLSNKLGSEAFWPTTLDKESDKAARILRSFCKDGFYAEEERPSADGPKQKQKVLKKIPADVIKNAKGLAIFTTMRTGLWVSGAGGSGVVIGRLPDGGWSQPSGIILHTAGLGFLVGVDIYDCVVVINSYKALEAFQRLRCTLGGEISAVAGPVGAGGLLETEVHKRQAPVFTYLKSRGFYAGVQIDGTVILERNDENERFYLEKIGVKDILAGKVRHPKVETRKLLETIRAAQGDTDVDESLMPSEPPPGDYEVEEAGHIFGVPAKDDPDPYGVLQLEKEGMSIREAGTQKRASWENFTFAPAPTSPLFSTFDKRNRSENASILSASRRGSWRTHSRAASAEQQKSEPIAEQKEPGQRPSRARAMSDMSTQTDDLPPPPSPSRSTHSGAHGSHRASMDGIPEDRPIQSGQASPSSVVVRKASRGSRLSHSETPPKTSPTEEIPRSDPEVSANDADAEDTGDEDDTGAEEEPVIVHSIQRTTTAQTITKAKIVNVPKRIAPTLPPRNPNRSGTGPLVIGSSPRASGETDRGSLASLIKTPTTETEHVSNLTEKAGGLNGTAQEMDDVDLSTDETPGDERDPWARVLEKREHRNSTDSHESLDVPGGFQSFPTTPEEEIRKA